MKKRLLSGVSIVVMSLILLRVCHEYAVGGNGYIDIINDSEGPVYEISLSYDLVEADQVEEQYHGRTATMAMSSQIPRSDEYRMFEAGEVIPIVFDKEEMDGKDQVLMAGFHVNPDKFLGGEKIPLGDVMEVPVQRGRKTILRLTGNEAEGFQIRVEATEDYWVAIPFLY